MGLGTYGFECTRSLKFGAPICTKYERFGATSCTKYLIFGATPCTKFRESGARVCTKYQLCCAIAQLKSVGYRRSKPPSSLILFCDQTVWCKVFGASVGLVQHRAPNIKILVHDVAPNSCYLVQHVAPNIKNLVQHRAPNS